MCIFYNNTYEDISVAVDLSIVSSWHILALGVLMQTVTYLCFSVYLLVYAKLSRVLHPPTEGTAFPPPVPAPSTSSLPLPALRLLFFQS